MRHLWPYIATHTLVASCAWTYGYVVRVHIERRNRELDEWSALRPAADVIDLTRPYNWAVDGECVRREVAR